MSTSHWAVTDLHHGIDCYECDKEVDRAITLAMSTGSVGATASTEIVGGGEVAHSATVKRVLKTIRITN